ncbi:unannotated protein [freshwater metagenome]|uniref:Unannotated protein n=1 Tax=freshwater metagenome TaxID=449393 RepID=A0A6J6FPC6_9ZZZZ|nr:hypothetical protein [Actinomycetota bacterium]
MLGGINNALFLQAFGGLFVVVLILIPILKWAFPANKSVKAEKALYRQMRKEIRAIKKK